MVTFLVGTFFLYVDSFAFTNYPSLQLIVDYVSSFAFAYYILYLSPHMQFMLTNWQNIERKSHKEMSFLNKLNFMFIFNSLICPLLNGLMLEYATGKGATACKHLVKHQEDIEKSLTLMSLVTVIDLQDFYTRLLIQLITLTIFDQLFLNFEKLTAIHTSIARN